MSNLDPRKVHNLELPTKEFRFFNASQISELPDMQWVVNRVLPAAGTACIYGPSGVGKSFLCLDLAAAIAEGRDWFGHATTRGRVVFLALEGQEGFRNRLAAWKAHHGREYPPNVSFVFESFEISTTTDPLALSEEIEQEGGAKVVIVDTLNRAMPGEDENGSLSMGRAILGASILQKQTSGLVLLIHHPGKDVSKKLRGHSSLYASLDTILEVKGDGGAVVWRTVKSKDGDGRVRHGFALKAVEFLSKSGRAEASCVIVEDDSAESQEAAKPKGTNQIEIARAVSQLLFDHRISAVAEGDLEGASLGLPIEEVREKISGLLTSLEPKRRKERANEALNALIEKGYFLLVDGMLMLGQTE